MTAILEAGGYEEIEARAASAFEHWIGSEGLSFRVRDDADRLGDVVRFRRGPRNKQLAAMLSVSVAEYDIADVRPLFGKGRA